MSYATSMIRSGRTHDIECSRSTNRLQRTWQILEGLGIKPEKEHGRHVETYDWATAGSLTAAKMECTHECRTILPGWLTDEIIDHAWNLADEMIRTRAAWLQRTH